MSPPSARAPVLLIEADEHRRRELAQGLAGSGLEIVPAANAAEGARYLEALAPKVVVVAAELLADPLLVDLVSPATTARLSVVAMGDAAAEAELPRRVFFLSRTRLTAERFLERLRLIVLARDLEVAVDPGLETLVGELGHHPIFDLLPALARHRVSGALELPGGTVYLELGEPIAAQTAPITGLKAFCRLARATEGPFRFRPGANLPAVQWEERLDRLLAKALEDSLGEMPDPAARLRLNVGLSFFARSFSPLEQRILAAAQEGLVVARLLDRCAPHLDGAVLSDLARLEREGHVFVDAPTVGVAIVTDSTSDLPAGEAKRLGIEVVPLRITFGQRIFEDGVDLLPAEFYRRLANDPEHPFTSPPTKEDFLLRYRPLLERGDVLSLHISEQIPSLTVVNARKAAEELAGASNRLEVLDTGQAASPLGLLAIFAARMARRGLATSEIRRRIEAIAPRIETLFIVDTLEYLARGGRIGRARAWVGNLLGIKPILGLAAGKIVPVERVRGGRAAQKRIVEMLAARADRERPTIIAVAHANAPAWAERLAELLAKELPVAELFQTEMGPVIGTHVGPGTVGAAILQPEADEAPLIAPLEP